MTFTRTPIYRKAFAQYLRKGTPVEISIKAMLKKQAHPTPYYTWRTAGDDKVRPSHAANEGKVFAWDNPPETGNPGEAINCRCWAEPYHIPDEPGLESSYLGSFAIGALLYLAARKPQLLPVIRTIIQRRLQREESPPEPPSEPIPKMDDTNTWPKPPRGGRFKEGDPSRSKPRSRGEKSLYDEQGGEWRYAPKDKYHDTPHWDYKPAGKAQEWQNISIDGRRIFK